MVMEIGIDYIGITTPFYCNDGKGNFLLHRRSVNTRDEHGRWDTGSGKLDFGVDLQENVLREVMEEYGCRGEIQEQLPVHSVFRQLNGKTTHWIAIPFFVKVNPDEVKNNEPHKIDEIGWFRLDSLPSPLHTGLEFAMKKFPEFFNKYR
jgi:8-oxo-dGTP diphosphatase